MGDTESMKSMSELSSFLQRLEEDMRAPPQINRVRVREGGGGARHQGADKNIIAAATASKLFTSNYAQRQRLRGAARARYCSTSSRSTGATRKSW